MFKAIKRYFGQRKALKEFNDYQNGIKAARKEKLSGGYGLASYLLISKYDTYTEEFKNGYKHELDWI